MKKIEHKIYITKNKKCICYIKKFEEFINANNDLVNSEERILIFIKKISDIQCLKNTYGEKDFEYILGIFVDREASLEYNLLLSNDINDNDEKFSRNVTNMPILKINLVYDPTSKMDAETQREKAEKFINELNDLWEK